MSIYLAQLVDGVVVHRFELKQGVVTLGRAPENDIVIDDAAVSSYHAQLHCETDSYFPNQLACSIEDLGSTNGTFLNDRALVGVQRLHDNDVIRIAWNQFKLMSGGVSAELDKTAHMASTQPGGE